MKIVKRIFWIIVITGLYSAWVVLPVSAHAELVRSVPEANAVLDESPGQVELLFSEPLEAGISTIKVYDSSGSTVEAEEAVVDPSNPERITVSVPPLPDGVYTVSWQVISQIDGHQTAGSFPFAVGQVDGSALPAEEQSTTTPVSAVIAKWLLLASAAILAGQFPSLVWIWSPALKSNRDDPGLLERLTLKWILLYRIGLAGVLLASGLGVMSQAGQTIGRELAFPWAEETTRVLSGTRLGLMWLIRSALALAGFLAVRGRPAVRKGMAHFAIGLALLLTISLTSHSATELQPFAPVIGDWLHLVGMSFWFGGLAHLIVGLIALKLADNGLRIRIASSAARRFSKMALPAVGAIGLTGLYSACLRVGSFSALVDTIYGQSLLIKQGFVAALLLIAGINLLIISPGLKREALGNLDVSKFLPRFGITVFVEIALACLLLINVSLMTYLPPAVTPLPQTTLHGISSVDDLKVALFISPGLSGRNTFDVRLSPRRSVESVTLTLVPVTSNIPPSEIQLIEAGKGRYTAQGGNLGFPGRWLVEVAVRRPDMIDAGVSFDFDVPKPDSSGEAESSSIAQLSNLLFILVFFLLGLNVIPLME